MALANKTARIVWAVAHRQENYQRMGQGYTLDEARPSFGIRWLESWGFVHFGQPRAHTRLTSRVLSNQGPNTGRFAGGGAAVV